MDLIGKTPIHPILFYSGKMMGYLTWIILLLMIFDVDLIVEYHLIITTALHLSCCLSDWFLLYLV